MRVAPAAGALATIVLLAGGGAPGVAAQDLKVRFLGVEMYGGAVWPRGMDTGVSFGTRVGLATLFGGDVRVGPALDWWTARRRGAPIDVRGVGLRLDARREFRPGEVVRPHIGAGLGLLSTDAAVDSDAAPPGAAATADRLDGYRFRADAIAGTSVRLSGTGALWLIIEYGYTVVARLSHHQLRAGIRLQLADL